MTVTPPNPLAARLIVVKTVLLEVSITDNLPVCVETYARVPEGLTATPNSSAPIAIVVTTVLLDVSMTDTSCDPRLAT